MNTEQIVKMLRWVNEVDPRVMFNEPAVETWAYAMRNADAGVAKQAVLEHYKANEGIAASPAAISKRARNIATAREAGNRAIALEPATPVAHPLSWRKRNPELWDELFEQGRIEANEERRRATEARVGAQEPDTSGWMAA